MPQSDSVAPKVAEAEAFLQDVKDSLRPHKVPKIEPVDSRSSNRSSLLLETSPNIHVKLGPPPRSSSSLSSYISSASKLKSNKATRISLKLKFICTTPGLTFFKASKVSSRPDNNGFPFPIYPI